MAVFTKTLAMSNEAAAVAWCPKRKTGMRTIIHAVAALTKGPHRNKHIAPGFHNKALD